MEYGHRSGKPKNDVTQVNPVTIDEKIVRYTLIIMPKDINMSSSLRITNEAKSCDQIYLNMAITGHSRKTGKD